MKRLLLLTALCLIGGSGFSQTGTSNNDAIRKTIQTMFDGMRAGDSTLVRSVLAPGMVLQTIVSRGGRDEVRTERIENFLKAVATPHEKVWDEQISFDAIHVDGPLASVWTSYKFYLGKDFSHCGVNSFQLVRLQGEWKINYLVDTRRKDNCD